MNKLTKIDDNALVMKDYRQCNDKKKIEPINIEMEYSGH